MASFTTLTDFSSWVSITSAASSIGSVITEVAQESYNCDGVSSFYCPTSSGTCYAGTQGFVGCCTTTGCSLRTTCLDYNTRPTSSCNQDVGGCFTCSDPALPSCVTLSNVVADQYVLYCDTTATSQAISYTPNAMILSTATGEPIPGPTAASPTPTSTATSKYTSSAPKTTKSTPHTTRSPRTGTTLPTPSDLPFHQPSVDATSPKLSGGSVAGIVIGTILALAVIIVGITVCLRQRKRESRSPKPSLGGNEPMIRDEKGTFMRNGYYTHNNDTPASEEAQKARDERGLGITDTTHANQLQPAQQHPLGQQDISGNGSPTTPTHLTSLTRQNAGLSIVNCTPPLPSGSTVDGLYHDPLPSAVGTAIELGSDRPARDSRGVSEADPDAISSGNGSSARVSRAISSVSGGLTPIVRTISPPTPGTQDWLKKRSPAPAQQYQAYRPPSAMPPADSKEDTPGRHESVLTTATGYSGYRYESPEEVMRLGWRND